MKRVADTLRYLNSGKRHVPLENNACGASESEFGLTAPILVLTVLIFEGM